MSVGVLAIEDVVTQGDGMMGSDLTEQHRFYNPVVMIRIELNNQDVSDIGAGMRRCFNYSARNIACFHKRAVSATPTKVPTE